jgi:hypothetical protein
LLKITISMPDLAARVTQLKSTLRLLMMGMPKVAEKAPAEAPQAKKTDKRQKTH